jgi:large subunit ribosomal protein L13
MSVANALLRHSHRPVWHLVDAKDQIVGRLAAQIAPLLSGKHKPTYSPNVACGDVVVVINAADVALTGKKWTDKVSKTLKLLYTP